MRVKNGKIGYFVPDSFRYGDSDLLFPYPMAGRYIHYSEILKKRGELFRFPIFIERRIHLQGVHPPINLRSFLRQQGIVSVIVDILENGDRIIGQNNAAKRVSVIIAAPIGYELESGGNPLKPKAFTSDLSNRLRLLYAQ